MSNRGRENGRGFRTANQGRRGQVRVTVTRITAVHTVLLLACTDPSDWFKLAWATMGLDTKKTAAEEREGGQPISVHPAKKIPLWVACTLAQDQRPVTCFLDVPASFDNHVTGEE